MKPKFFKGKKGVISGYSTGCRLNGANFTITAETENELKWSFKAIMGRSIDMVLVHKIETVKAGTMKIEAIKQELCKLKDGKSFTASMTIKEVDLAIGALDFDDRFFTKDQEGGMIRVTCHYSEKSKADGKKLGWLAVGIIGALLAFSIAQTAFLDMEKSDAKSELVE